MEAFIQFLQENWKVLLEFLFLLVSLVIFCLKKKTKVNISSSIISNMLIRLPSWINEAEFDYGASAGEKKLLYVFKKAVSFISEETGLSLKDVTDYYGQSIRSSIEEILETPQKKEI